MTERVLPAIIEVLGEYKGRLVWHHCRDSRLCEGGSGLPDLIIAGPGGVLFAEVKPGTWSMLRPQQTTWRHMLLASGAYHVVWTQADVDNGKVRAGLDAILLSALRREQYSQRDGP